MPESSINETLAWLDNMAKAVSNIGKPDSDNNYGRAATALRLATGIK